MSGSTLGRIESPTRFATRSSSASGSFTPRTARGVLYTDREDSAGRVGGDG